MARLNDESLSGSSPPTKVESLDRLLVSLFSTTTALRGFLRDLPDGADLESSVPEGTSRANLAHAATLVLLSRGTVDTEFFSRLTRKFPGRRSRIAETARVFGLEAPTAEPVAGSSDSGDPVGSLLVDNWLLQDVANFFQGRLDPQPAPYLEIDPATDSHSYRRGWAISSQVESVLSFVTELVLRDHLSVEQEFADAWLGNDDGLDSLVHTALVRPVRVSTDWARFKQRRGHIVNQLCVTQSLRAVQAQIEQDFAARRPASEPMHSQVVYGTAGNLARSALLGVPHLPHPLRKYLLMQTSFSGRDAVALVQGWIQRERAALFERVMPAGLLRSAHATVAPIAVLALRESRDTSDLLRVALQLRDYHAPLREWLAYYQRALQIEDPAALMECNEMLASLECFIHRSPNIKEYGQLCYDFCAQRYSEEPEAAQRLDTATSLGTLVFAPKGEAVLRQFLQKCDLTPDLEDAAVEGFRIREQQTGRPTGSMGT